MKQVFVDFLQEQHLWRTFQRKALHTLFHGKPEKWVVSKYIRGKTLNVGAGRDRIPGTISVDNGQYKTYTDWDCQHDVECEATELHHRFNRESIDCVLASHLVEHLRVPQEFYASAHIVLKKGGHLCLVCPDYENMGSVAYFRDPTHLWGCVPGIMRAEFRNDPRWKVLQFNRLSFWFPFSFDIVLEKL